LDVAVGYTSITPMSLRLAAATLFGLVLAPTAPMSASQEQILGLPDGVAMAYLDRGAGEPALVFVHCGNGRKEIWAETLDAFAPTHRVVAMDLPGHGRSGSDRDGFTIADLGADVATLAAHLKVGKLILVGNSLGGPVALEAARRLGRERVLGVVAVDTLHDVEQVWPEEAIRQRVEAYRRDFRGSCRELMLSLLPEDAAASARARIERDTCANDPRAAIALMESVPAYDQAASIAAAGVPVWAINSTMFPTAVEVNRRHAVSFELILMEGVGHYPQIERPEEFQRHLHRVVDELAGGPASPAPGPGSQG
jgi:sigma-B regulation protein RsbQ